MKMMPTISLVSLKGTAQNSLHLRQMVVVLVAQSGMDWQCKMSGWTLDVVVLRIFKHSTM
jgi:hypothetical protein